MRPPERSVESVVERWSREPRLAESKHFFAIRDAYPVSQGHSLIVSKRECRTIFDLTADELADLHRVLQSVREKLDTNYGPTGYNVGANAGADAGQTIDWCHIHVIPRYRGDVPDPRGGVRGVIAGRSTY